MSAVKQGGGVTYSFGDKDFSARQRWPRYQTDVTSEIVQSIQSEADKHLHGEEWVLLEGFFKPGAEIKVSAKSSAIQGAVDVLSMRALFRAFAALRSGRRRSSFEKALVRTLNVNGSIAKKIINER